VFNQLNPGFSGTKLIKVKPFDKNNSPLHNTWILKIAEHDAEINKLHKELEGYEAVRNRIPRIFRPELYTAGSDYLKYVLDNWWGAFAMSFEGEFYTLINSFSEISPEEIYSRVFQECLRPLYGQCLKFDRPMSLPEERTVTNVIKTLQKLERFNEVFSHSYKDYSSDITKLSNRLPTISHTISKRIGESPVGKGIVYMHGDLNCRNIMVKRSNGINEFRLIDFPKVVSDNLRPAATDYVKAEAELLFLIMDYQTGFDIDPTRIPKWTDIFRGIASSLDAKGLKGFDKHLNKVCKCLRTIRSEYASFVGSEDNDWIQYRLVLLEHVLRYITYPDITPVKQAAACLYSELLADGLLK